MDQNGRRSDDLASSSKCTNFVHDSSCRSLMWNSLGSCPLEREARGQFNFVKLIQFSSCFDYTKWSFRVRVMRPKLILSANFCRRDFQYGRDHVSYLHLCIFNRTNYNFVVVTLHVMHRNDAHRIDVWHVPIHLMIYCLELW